MAVFQFRVCSLHWLSPLKNTLADEGQTQTSLPLNQMGQYEPLVYFMVSLPPFPIASIKIIIAHSHKFELKFVDLALTYMKLNVQINKNPMVKT